MSKANSNILQRILPNAQKLVQRVTREHASETETDYLKSKIRILILGAGFGGLAAALKLDRLLDPSQDASVLVIDRNNYSFFDPLLWTVASGRTNPSSIVVPIRTFQRGRSFHVLHAEIERIDLNEKTVYTSAGPPLRLSYPGNGFDDRFSKPARPQRKRPALSRPGSRPRPSQPPD